MLPRQQETAMSAERKPRLAGSFVRLAVLAITAISLAGCIIVPERHFYRPAPYPYYYR
jgi:hypothetical protein